MAVASPQALPELVALLELLKLIGVPGLLGFLSLPLIAMSVMFWFIIRNNAATQRHLQEENNARWDSLLKAHKEERDRDFKHLSELMNTNAGLYQRFGDLVQRLETMDRSVLGLANAMPEMARSLHARFDVLLLNQGKGANGNGNSGSEGPAAGR